MGFYEKVELYIICVLVVCVILACIRNILFYRSLKKTKTDEKLSAVSGKMGYNDEYF